MKKKTREQYLNAYVQWFGVEDVAKILFPFEHRFQKLFDKNLKANKGKFSMKYWEKQIFELSKSMR